MANWFFFNFEIWQNFHQNEDIVTEYSLFKFYIPHFGGFSHPKKKKNLVCINAFFFHVCGVATLATIHMGI